jgi:prepilin-type N-terminal cleavage/methylation domain-containing protein
MAMVRRHGFTLIELLVVISLIGILVVLITVSFTTAQQRSRDAKRRADIQAIQKSLEQCYVLNQLYPDALSGGSSLTCGTQTTMNLVPEDPKNSGLYVYTYSVDATQMSYCLCAYLEQIGSGNADTSGSDGACSYNDPKDYQCVGSQQ